jgi:hypothetical protein
MLKPIMMDMELPIERVRERVVEQLKLNYAHDNIVVDEFERRISLAHESDDRDALKSLVRDLPVLKDSAVGSYQQSSYTWALNDGKVKRDDSMIAILGGVERKGSWAPARYNKVLAFMGGVDLDFTEAKLPEGVTEIDLFCVMGGVELIVPDGVNVEMQGVPIMGGFEDKTDHTPDERAPTIRIRGLVLMGGVEAKPPKKKKRRRNR